MATDSTPEPLSESRAVPNAQPAARQENGVHTTLDRNFDAIRIENTPAGTVDNQVIDEDDHSLVSRSKAESYITSLLDDPKNRLGLSALSKANPAEVLLKRSAAIKDAHTFNVAIPLEGSPVTNQRKSGRCWIFAATNVFRIAIQEKYDIKNFELSQSYLFFWDKVEKANYYLQAIVDSAENDIDSRIVAQLNSGPVNDGGQWDMIVNLVSKYGIVPQTLYPDSWNAENSAVMDSLLTVKLREFGVALRKLVAQKADKSTITSAQDRMLQEIVRIVTLCLGPPPSAHEKFTWEFHNSKKEFQSVSMTPLEFGATTEVKKFFSLVNDPRNEYNRLLTVEYLGNVWEGQPITYVNVDTNTLKEAGVAMLKKGLPIFFGCDVGKFSDRTKGIMDTDLIDYELGFNIRLNLTKAERLLTGESQMTHAMVLTAVHLDKDGKPVRWRVENSWAESSGKDGYFVMTDEWMDEFNYQIVVDPSVVSEEIRNVLKQMPKVLPLWDPMGSLA